MIFASVAFQASRGRRAGPQCPLKLSPSLQRCEFREPFSFVKRALFHLVWCHRTSLHNFPKGRNPFGVESRVGLNPNYAVQIPGSTAVSAVPVGVPPTGERTGHSLTREPLARTRFSAGRREQ